jgi:uncharacterized protein
VTSVHDDAAEVAFGAALLDPALPVPAGLYAHNRSDPVRRFAVHRNNVVHSLVVALGVSFPVCRGFVGSEFFDVMAAQFLRVHPPRGPVLAEWGEALPGFIEAFAPAARHPVLADLARVEWARQCAWHAADAAPLDTASLQVHLAQPKTLPRARLALHPALHSLELAAAGVSVWAAHQGLATPGDIDPAQAESAWVLRPADEVLVQRVSPGLARWATALQGHATLAEACAIAQAREPGFDLAAALALALRHGAIVGWTAGRTVGRTLV